MVGTLKKKKFETDELFLLTAIPGDYLCGCDHRSGSHKKYYPSDMTAHDARIELANVSAKF